MGIRVIWGSEGGDDIKGAERVNARKTRQES